MSDLLKSRWAPSPSEIQAQPAVPPITTPAIPPKTIPKPSTKRTPSPVKQPSRQSSPRPSPSSHLSRFMKIVERLKWKLPYLAYGYRLATLDPASSDFDVSHAEIMFKLDFHEYYSLLERAIVHLLSVFGVSVSSAFARNHLAAYGSAPLSTHRYHANVLEALQDENSPLHTVLGQGEVHEQLQRAKELRNRWKTADLTKEELEMEDKWAARRKGKAMPLASYDIEKILSDIFQGFDDAYLLAQEHVVASDGADKMDGLLQGESDADWDFIVDAMDWEAV
ncbi:uncharacterized protein AKAW2_10065A [Aspergillus luchuensis]|uniref:Fungal specific transcription factor n=2 Tax=Aspergillus kawachii TaxID=1069201 RepID=A0A146F9H3_ASPKA|nr:uncharacterized protein AKAW2_10065A [Aspergillus luchuensis]OJZ90098.1 hypothetical protein ASPFODRAFT_43467 [Aspergillus luchuensis CBS 106.47]GAA92549.1 fungal specific transcription factor [Aspergillus luchuensis IFO 4308]BCR93019.1 hypothetical protein AKAW2_10065A [Aspergillus luchuensis]BCS05678.1 hypothetical protein ALUC_10059A [Aspergillus luchuensis]GAT22884.1 fungal specific transcription factor [Aspergillus luchuensis]